MNRDRWAESPRSNRVLLEEYGIRCRTSPPGPALRLSFHGVDGDVYNGTAPFADGDARFLAARVEARDSEIASVRLFRETAPGSWAATLPHLVFQRFQDPFVVRIGQEIVLGGVQIDTDPLRPDTIISYRTLFYRGRGLADLRLFARGPERMKDIRPVGLPDGSVGVFTRPQGGAAGMGRIGYVRIPGLDALDPEAILSARVHDTHFVDGEWGGVNEPRLLSDGTIGVLGHIAWWEHRSVRHYHAMAFRFDPSTERHTPVRIIARRSDLLPGPAKRPDLEDVLFSGGLERDGRGQAILYTGVSDAEIQCLSIPDPFLES